MTPRAAVGSFLSVSGRLVATVARHGAIGDVTPPSAGPCVETTCFVSCRESPALIVVHSLWTRSRRRPGCRLPSR